MDNKQICTVGTEHAAVGIIAEGRVLGVRGPGIMATIPLIPVGAVCQIIRDTGKPLLAKVVGFEEERVALAPFDSLEGVAAGQKIVMLPKALALPAIALKPGTVHDCFGNLFDLESKNASEGISSGEWPIRRAPPLALRRKPVNECFVTGVKIIDTLVPLGCGQRVGLFAGAGVGKSTLLGMLAANADVDVVVVGLIGERGRELGEFLEDCLTPEARAKTSIIVATSDESAARRWLAAETATAIAEYHRNQGKRVLLLMDSLTRVARAIREMTLAAGELPVRQGYTASVFSELPVLLERAGNDAHGTMTAVYTILMQGDNDADPLSDELKSLLDGHLVLHPSVAARGLRPAVDVTQSISRVVGRIVSSSEVDVISEIIAAYSRLKRDRDLEAFGGKPDEALKHLLSQESAMMGVLAQRPRVAGMRRESFDAADLRRKLVDLIRC